MTDQQTLPRIAVLTTGGTIAGSGDSSTGSAYTAAQTAGEQLLSSVAQIRDIAQVEVFEVCRIGSQDMTDAIQIALAQKINQIWQHFDGIVVTHGTDTMEETAYFLSLTTHSEKPVVLTGSMRPPTAMGADGPRNLFNACLSAARQEVASQGVVVCMNDVLIRARDVIKANTVKVESFQAVNGGIAGLVVDNRVHLESLPVKPMGKETPFDVEGLVDLPRVGIVYNHSSVGSEMVSALVDAGYEGIVSAGFGNGTIHKNVLAVLASAARQGVAVVRSSRVASGFVTQNGEIDDKAYGFIASGSLNPQKSRILLQLGLTQSHQVDELQSYFGSY